MIVAHVRCPRELLEKLAEDAIRCTPLPPSMNNTLCPARKLHLLTCIPLFCFDNITKSSRTGEGSVGPVCVVRHAVGHVH